MLFRLARPRTRDRAQSQIDGGWKRLGGLCKSNRAGLQGPLPGQAAL